MKNQEKSLRIDRWILIAAILFGVGGVSASVFFVTVGGRRELLPQAILAGIFFMLLFGVLLLLVCWRRSMRKTVYSYLNIGLIGGMLFLSVMALVILGYFLSCLSSHDLSLHHIFQTVIAFPHTFSYYAVCGIVLISVLVGISNVVLIRREGLCLHNALSLVVACFYVGGTVFVYLVCDLLEKYVFRPTGLDRDPRFVIPGTVIPLFLLLMLCYFECIFLGTLYMGWSAVRITPAYDKDFVIIPGCSIDRRGGLLPLLKGRVNRAVRFAWEQEIATERPVLYVPSGGQGSNEIMSEGSAMELYLLSHGAETDEVFPEKESRTTYENFCRSAEIIEKIKPDAKVAFATTNYHVLRCGILARRAGLEAEGIAAGTKWYFWPNGFIREFFGILALNIRAHIAAAVCIAIVCTLLGCLGYIVNFI